MRNRKTVQKLKLKAQLQLLETRGTAFWVGIWICFFKVLFAFCILFCLYFLKERVWCSCLSSAAAKGGCLFAFAIGGLSALFLLAQLSVLRARWFMENTDSKQTFSALFRPLPMVTMCRATALFCYLWLARLLYALLFFAPLSLCFLKFWQHLRVEGMEKHTFALWLLLLCLLFIASVYFYFAYMQKYSGAVWILAQHGTWTLRQILQESKKRCAPYSFLLLYEKSTFLLWWMFSVFLLPLYHTLPYYWQTQATVHSVLLQAETPCEREDFAVYCPRIQTNEGQYASETQ